MRISCTSSERAGRRLRMMLELRHGVVTAPSLPPAAPAVGCDDLQVQLATDAARSGSVCGVGQTGFSGDVIDTHRDVQGALTSQEWARCSALSSSTARQAYVAAHILVRVCAGRLAGQDPARLTVVQRCSRCGGPHGRPRLIELPDLSVTLSHAGRVVAAAATRGRIGIDVDDVSFLHRSDDVEATALTPKERSGLPRRPPTRRLEVLRHWVRKEALIKTGAATLDDLARIDMSGLPADTEVRAAGVLVTRWMGWCVTDWAGDRTRAGAAVSDVPLTFTGVS